MKKYKIYIHHYYTYELFWLYCHGLKIEPKNVPTWFNDYNRWNKNIKVETDVVLTGEYKGNEIEVVFCNTKHWDKTDGFHLFDYSINLLEDGLVADRGFNANLMREINKKNLTFLNSKASHLEHKIHYFYIDWESHYPYVMEGWYTNMNPKIHFFVDEVQPNYNNPVPTHHFVFTNLIWSFIYPNTLGIRDYYFFGDYLKYKNDYKYKINVPIRRLYGDKELMAQEILKLNNPHISVTQSSFGDENQITPDDHVFPKFREELISTIPSENFIQKRGHRIHDWGGEWNSNNMNENMWKMFEISEVNILFEYSPTHNIAMQKKNSRTVGFSYVTEKSISHILVGKPFIPFYKETIDFFDEWLRYYNKTNVKFPLEYDYILEKIDYLDNLTKNEKEWEIFLNDLKKYVLNLREHLMSIIHKNNSYFEYIFSKSEKNKITLL